MASGDDEVIPLSRFRAALARARTGKRAEALLSEPNVEQLIPQLPVQDLYFAIREVGLSDASDLLALASPEQFQGLLDLDVWQGDAIEPDKMQEWLDALVDCGPDQLAKTIDALDPELIALYIQRRARIYDLSMEEVPEEPEGRFMPTPDTFFLLDVLQGGETGKSVERLIDWLYRGDLSIARRVIMSARWEMTADLEEWSYRWRSGRLADLGYADYYDALVVYRYLDPESVHIGENTRAGVSSGAPATLPATLGDSFDERGFFGTALGTVADADALAGIHGAIVTLANRVLAADRATPGDLTEAQRALKKCVLYTGLGLEYLSRGDPQRGGEALTTIALERIFRVGVSLTLQLHRLAQTLYHKGRIQTAPGAPTLLDDPYGALLTALRRPLPEYVGELDQPPSPGTTRPFVTLLDVGRAARALEEAASAAPIIFDGLGVDPIALRTAPVSECVALSELRFSHLARTLAAHVLCGRQPSLTPLTPTDFPILRAACRDGQLTVEARARVDEALGARLGERGLLSARPVLLRWLDRWLTDFATLDRILHRGPTP